MLPSHIGPYKIKTINEAMCCHAMHNFVLSGLEAIQNANEEQNFHLGRVSVQVLKSTQLCESGCSLVYIARDHAVEATACNVLG